MRIKGKKVGRNSPCPCGSDKKFKQCCLKNEQEEQSKDLQYAQDKAKADIDGNRSPAAGSLDRAFKNGAKI